MEICSVMDDTSNRSFINTTKDLELNQNQLSHDNRSSFISKKDRFMSLNPSRFKALQSDGMSLDISSYYCGHEKSERLATPINDVTRDEKNVTDSLVASDSQPKSLIAHITLQFPITSNDQEFIESSDDKKSSSLNDEFHYFRDTIQWDLSDVNTPTPILFASQIAEEYGLSFIQTMELAQSIQRQLQLFVEQNCAHSTPIALRGILSSSPSLHVLDYKPVPLVPHLYGEVMESNGPEGSCRPLNQITKLQKAIRSSSSISSFQSDSKAVQKSKDRTSAELDHSVSTKKRSSQSTTPETTVHPNILKRCKSISTGVESSTHGTREGRISKGKTKRFTSSDKKVVSAPIKKVPTSEFPREVAADIDLDHLYESDYRTLFMASGSSLKNPKLSDHEQVSHPPIVECNVERCHVCSKVGNLICCDFCPRVYHTQCLPAEQNMIFDHVGRWECYTCRGESQSMSEDKVTGDDYYTIMCTAYDDLVDLNGEVSLFGPRQLSMILDLVHRLIVYDFGFMFQDPVDTQIPTYTTIVKRPMDLGTISSKLEQGLYKECVRTRESCFDDIALAALQDLELVWHNCFLFNCEGSSIYRMAEVQRKRANAIRMASFDQNLSELVKEKLLQFITSCERERDGLRLEATSARSYSAQFRQKTKYKISGTVHQQSHSKPVAILDPETGRIVKVYSSFQTAYIVATSFFEKNFECEVRRDSIFTVSKLRTLVMQSKTDSACTLFGYRWIVLDDLRHGRVSFPVARGATKKSKNFTKDLDAADAYKKMNSVAGNASPLDSEEETDSDMISGFIQLTDGDKSYVFNSVEESLSFPGIKADIPSARKQLKALVAKLDFTDNFGRTWRLLDQTAQNADDVMKVSEAPIAQSAQFAESDDSTFRIVKMDLVSGLKLLEFHSIGSAFQDWLYTLDATIDVENEKTIGSFQSQYLDGNRNVDGICWKTVSAVEVPKP